MSLVRPDEVVGARDIAFEAAEDCGADFELVGNAPLFELCGVASVVDETVGEGVHDERRPAENYLVPYCVVPVLPFQLCKQNETNE